MFYHITWLSRFTSTPMDIYLEMELTDLSVIYEVAISIYKDENKLSQQPLK